MDNKDEIKILVVDDSILTLEVLERTLTKKGYIVSTASSVREGIKLLENSYFNLVITDYKMPEITGFELIKYVTENLKNTDIIMVTGYPTIEGAVEAIKIGAEHYLSKPFTNSELFDKVEKILLKQKEKNSDMVIPSFSGIVGDSPPIKSLFNLIKKGAKTDVTILITGESGTGKELVARAIHYSSNRSSSPFIPINCGGIPENLLESELFGYKKGAFTGAYSDKDGFFKVANRGTIFLDEIGEISLAMQVKLLRVLQDRKITPIGSTKSIDIDLRIIAATNRDFELMLEDRTFREDLYYRLNIFPIEVPPLRDRGDDILILSKYFIKKYSNGKDIEVTDQFFKRLLKYHWPGNVRELENIIHRAVILSEGAIDTPSLPNFMRYKISKNPKDIERTLKEVEVEHIKMVLNSVGNNKSQAAKILGIDRKTLRKKLKDD